MKTMKLNKYFLATFAMLTAGLVMAQLPDGFDIKAAYLDASQKNVPASDVERYVESQHREYLHNHGGHSHTSTNPSLGIQNVGTVYVNGSSASGRPAPAPTPGPNTPQNQYCPNAGFEQNTFANWTGGYGTVAAGAVGAAYPIYNQTAPTIQNGAGNNVGLMNLTNYHTIMTTAAVNPIHPNLVGYDSIASRVISGQTVSEIPFVNPAGGPTSVRLNSPANFGNYRAAKLNYVMALNPNNKNFSVSYALVLENGGHQSHEQPYFSVRVTDQNGALVPGCSQYTITCSPNVTNPSSSLYDPLWKQSSVTFDALYRPWQSFAFDFSNYPAITSVNVEFYVGGCAQGGHWGYAYVDAQCSQGGAVASFCAGSNTSVLTAPVGYSTYQWTGPSGPITVANGGNTGTATISPVTAGQVFTCAVTAPNGCSSVFTTTVSITTVSITGVGSTPSCLNGNSGTAMVSATGSSSGYSYQWFNSSGGVVGSTQTATGLSPGTYSVTVSSPMCGSNSSTVAVGISAPTFYALNANYCGTVGWITKNGGSNYKWYTANPLALIPSATTPTLTINAPVNGAQYFLCYTTAGGCKDSIKYTLSQIPGGSIYVSNIKSICPGNNNSYAVVNLQTSAPPMYSYTVTGPSGYNSVLSNTTTVKDSVTNLSIGTYTANVFDGQCMYNTTFTVSPFVYSYTLTPTSPTVCTTGGTSLTVNFGNITPQTCGLSTTGGCTSPNQITMGTGTTANSTTGYPAIYGNWYRNTRHQILYRAAELLAAGVQPGKISSISWSVTQINGTTTYPDFTIKMKCTSVTDLSAAAFDGVGLTQVYYAPSVNVTAGWNTYNFPTSYEWDGVSNILIDVCNSQTPSYTQNSASPYSITPFISVRWFNSDGTVACPIATGNSYAPNNTYRPNIRFTNCGGQNPSLFTYSWTPSTSLSSTNTYTTFATPMTTTIYTVQVNPIGQTNCMQAQTSTVTIVNPASPTITAVNPMCTNASAITLTVNPTGGVWSGSGISPAGVLTPGTATPGTNTYTYMVGSGTCSAIGSTTISIEQFIPSTITSSLNPQCNTNATLPLPTTASPTGTWTGTGVTGTNFEPAVAGVGNHVLTYSTTSSPTASLCPSTSTIMVAVSSITQPTIAPAGPYCDSYPVQTMTVAPVGGGSGTWGTSSTGTSITTNGDFSPSSSIVGLNVITYTLVNGPCTAIATETVVVTHYVDPATNGTGPFCIYEPVVDLNPLATNPGGIWSGNGVTGTNFDPATAGAGTHVLTYSTNPVPFIPNLCSASSTVSIQVNPTPTVVPLAYKYADCNYPFVASFYTPSVNTGTLTWNFGDGSSSSANNTGFAPFHTYTTPGNYTVTTSYMDNVGCTASSTVATAITVYQVPIADFTPSPDVTTVVDGEVTFNNQSSDLNNNTYVWNFAGLGGSSDVSPVYLFTNSGEYFVTLIATSQYGCQNTAVKKVTVNPDVVLYVPNAFTPNGDGLNDDFQIFLPPTGVDYSTFSLTVYDRWGEAIYKSNDVYKFWNGAKNNSGDIVKQDTYVYKITFKDDKKKFYQRVGYVTLLSGK
jgi:gliding motility-associated-like protein